MPLKLVAQSKSILCPTYKHAKLFTLGLCQNKLENTDVTKKCDIIKHQQALQCYFVKHGSKVIPLFVYINKIQ